MARERNGWYEATIETLSERASAKGEGPCRVAHDLATSVCTCKFTRRRCMIRENAGSDGARPMICFVEGAASVRGA
jgi:hypothetical protein